MDTEILKEIIIGITAILVATLPGILAYYLAKKRDSRLEKEIRTENHPIFNRLDFNKNIIISGFSLENKGKEKVFKDILLKHMEIYKVNLKTLSGQIGNAEISQEQIFNFTLNSLNNIIYSLNNFYKVEDEYTSQEKKVLKIVMDKYSLWNLDREQMFITRMQEICASNVYQNNNLKAYLVLDTFLYMINDTINDASRTLNNINGDLTGLKFKGVVI